MTGRFTGWHMATILIAFFGVVVAVNLIMARYAVATFGGTVVDNSYVASQHYNHWLAQADRQAKLGWTPKLMLDSDRRLVVSVAKDGAPLKNLAASGVAIHPLGQAPSVDLLFAPSASGALISNQSLPAGRWRVHLTLRRGADAVALDQPIQ
jgi:nitrogen fixation protein FixH